MLGAVGALEVRASSTRFATPTLRKMLRRWVSTVFGLRKSSAAISALHRSGFSVHQRGTVSQLKCYHVAHDPGWGS
jgi:hypothetical protein